MNYKEITAQINIKDAFAAGSLFLTNYKVRRRFNLSLSLD